MGFEADVRLDQKFDQSQRHLESEQYLLGVKNNSGSQFLGNLLDTKRVVNQRISPSDRDLFETEMLSGFFEILT